MTCRLYVFDEDFEIILLIETIKSNIIFKINNTSFRYKLYNRHYQLLIYFVFFSQ